MSTRISLLTAVGTAAVASADTAPAAGIPATVAADALPTMQINGIVWAQVTVGNIVYATGNFTAARPAGAAPGTQQSAAGNIVAYDITTGVRVASFNHSLNAQGLSLAASSDGSTLYVGGDFTSVDGQNRRHIAAFSVASGALTGFAPYVGSEVRAIAARNSVVYVGGSFQAAGNQARTNLAAFTSAGALTAWAPTADNGFVTAMVLSPDRTRVIVGGHFSSLNQVAAGGMGSLDSTTGATMPWAANRTITDYGPNAAIDTLSTDGTQIYGGGYLLQTQPVGSVMNFEGTFAANPYTGVIAWLNDCHGDSYSTFVSGAALYSAGHAHDCSAVGSFPNYTPSNEPWHRAIAESTVSAGGHNIGPDSFGWNFNGIADSSVLQWFPHLAGQQATAPAGTVAVSGASQAAWSLTGDAAGRYLAAGGEFPTVGTAHTPQQGLVRFAVAALAPNKTGPEYSSVVAPAVSSPAPGSARLTWTAAWDRDNQNLTYRLYLDGSSTAIYSTVISSNFWTRPPQGFNENQLSAGNHRWVMKVTDPRGNSVSVTTATLFVS